MEKKKTKKKKGKLDKQSSASIVLAFTMMFFLVTMFMVTQQLGTSYALPNLTYVPETLTFSGTLLDNDPTSENPKWRYSNGLIVGFDFKAKDTKGTEYDMFCVEAQKGVDSTDTYTSPTHMDYRYASGVAWILNHANEFTGSLATANEKKYVTQFAIWLYLDEWEDQLTDEQVATINSHNDIYAQKIRELAQAGKAHNDPKAGSISVNTSNVQFTVEGDYIYSSEISVTSNKPDFWNGYAVGRGVDVDEGLEIVDANGNVSNVLNFSNDSKFRIRVPLNKIKDSENFEIKINVHGYFNDAVYEYYSSTGSQRPIIAELYDEIAIVTLSIPLTEVTKTDITNGKPVSGAKLLIKDSNGVELASWVTDGNPHYVSLPAGDYTLTEITSPDGYELNKESVSFTVAAGSKITKVEMKNTPTTPVPNTLANIPVYLYIIGAMIVIIGGAVIYFTVKPAKK